MLAFALAVFHLLPVLSRILSTGNLGGLQLSLQACDFDRGALVATIASKRNRLASAAVADERVPVGCQPEWPHASRNFADDLLI